MKKIHDLDQRKSEKNEKWGDFMIDICLKNS
jgi:hypothetical protein